MKTPKRLQPDYFAAVLAVLAVLLALFAAPAAWAATTTWSSGAANGNWNNSANWVGGVPAAADTAVFNGTSGSQNQIYIGTTSGKSVTSINFASGATVTYSIKLAAGPNSGGAGDLTVGSGGTITVADGFSHNIGTGAFGSGTVGNLVLGGNYNISTTSGNLTIDQPVTGATFSITKSGSGTLTLSGANTYSGGTTNTGGVLQADNSTALGTGLLVMNGGALSNSVASIVLNNPVNLAAAATVGVPSAVNFTLGGIISNTFALTKVGSGTLILTNANTYSGGTTNTAGTLQADNSAALGTGLLVMNGGTLSNNVAGIILTNRINLAAATTVGVPAGTNFTLGGIISNTFSLTKVGAGTLSLTNANTYSGGTTNTAGFLVANNNTAFGTGLLVMNGGTLSNSVNSIVLANPVNLAAATSTVGVPAGTNFTLGGAITNTGGLTMVGSGASQNVSTLTLTNANNSYSGLTTINGGRLQIGTSPTALSTNTAVSVASGAQIFLNAGAGTYSNSFSINGNGIFDYSSSSFVNVNAGAIRYGSTTVLSNGLITLAGNSRIGCIAGGNYSGTIADRITGNFGLEYYAAWNNAGGAATCLLNNPGTASDYTGDTTIRCAYWSGGFAASTNVVKLGANEQIPNGAGKGNLVFAAGIPNPYYSTFELNGFNETVNGISANASGFTNTIQNTASAASVLTIGDANTNSSFSGLITDGGVGKTLAITKIGTGTLALSGANAYTGGTTNTLGTLQADNNTALGTGLLVMNGGTLSNNVASITLNNPVSLAQPATVGVPSAVNFTLGGIITNTGSLTKVGAGTLTLINANTYSGITTNSAGILQIGNAGNTGTLGSGGVTNNSTLSFYRTDTSTFSANMAGSGNLLVAKGGTLTLASGANVTQANVYAGDAFVAGMGAGTIVVQNGASLTVTGQFGLGAQDNSNGTNNQTGGTVNLTTSVADNIRIGFWSSLTGAYNLSGGTLNAPNTDTTLSYDGTGIIAISGGTANLRGVKFSTGSKALTGTLNLSGTGTLNLGAGGIYDGSSGANVMNINFSGGTLGALAAWSSSLPVNLTGTTTIDTTGGNIALSGALTNTGAITKTGAGTLTLSGANTYSGGTANTFGTLQADNNTALGTGLLVMNGGTLSNSVASIVLNNPVSLAANSTVGVPAGMNFTLSGIITNSGSLTKAGAGTLTLSGSTISYSGSTVVSAGKLVVSSTHSGTGAATVSANAALAVTASGTSQWPPAALTLADPCILEFNNVQNSGTTNAPIWPTSAVGAVANVTINVNSISGVVGTGNSYPLLGNQGGTTSGYTLGTQPANVTGHLDFSGSTLVYVVDAAPDVWTGADVTNPTWWDVASSLNWVGNAMNNTPAGSYTNGDSVLFDDTASTNWVALQTPVLPASVAFANSTRDYTVTASGANVIAGTGSLLKSGSGKVTLLGGTHTYSGATTISAGTLQLGDGTSGNDATIASSSSVTNNGALVYNRFGGASYGGVISGTGTVTKTGAGTQTLSGTNTYSGATTISAGKLVGVTGGSCSNSALTVLTGATNGVQLAAADGQWVGKALTNYTGSYVELDYNGSLSPSTTVAPLLVTGNLALTNTTILVRNYASLGVGQYPLIKFGNTLTVSGTLTCLTNGTAASIVTNWGSKTIDLVVAAGDNTLTWATDSGRWDVNTNANWKSGGVAGFTYQDGKAVVLDDTASSAGSSILVTNAMTSVTPASVTVNVTNKSYTLSGGLIAGSGALTVNGPSNAASSLTLLGTNSYTGGTVLNGATLVVNTNSALGTGLLTFNGGALSNSAASTITNAANLAVNSTVANAAALTLSGTITNTGALNYLGTGSLKLSGTNTYSGGTTLSGGNISWANSSAFGTGPVTWNAPCQYYSGNVTVNFTNSLTMNGAYLRLGGAAGFTVTWSGPITLATNGCIIGSDGNLSASAVNLSGNVSFGANGTSISSVPGDSYAGAVGAISGLGGVLLTTNTAFSGPLSLNGAVSGPISLYHNGANNGTLVLGTANTFNGTARSQSGTLQVNNALGLQNATLDMNASDSGAVTLASGSTLGGLMGARNLGLTGTVSIGNNNSSTIYSGALTNTGSLTKVGTGTLTLSGLSATPANNYSGTTTIGNGTLAITNTSPSLTGGLTFGGAAGSSVVGTLDLSAASATFGGAFVVQTDSSTANTNIIGSGQTLQLTNAVTVGYNSAANSTTKLNVTGAGTLSIGTSGTTPTGKDVQVGAGQGSSIYNSATFDMSGLASFNAYLGTGSFKVGDIANSGGAAAVGSSVILATNSTIQATALTLGFQGNQTQSLKLGSGANVINVATLNLTDPTSSTSRGNGSLTFNGATGTLKVRSLADTVNGRATLNIGVVNFNTGSSQNSSFDTTGHSADLRFGTMNIGSRSIGVGITTGAFSFDTGTLDADNLTAGSRSGSATTSTTTGTVSLGGGTVTINTITAPVQLGVSSVNNATAAGTLNISGGTVTVAANGGTSIRLGQATTAGGAATGTVNLTGGTLTVAGDIIRGATTGTSTAQLTNNGATLNMNGKNITGLTTITYASGLITNLGVVNTGMTLAGTGSREFGQAGGTNGTIQGVITDSGLGVGLTKSGAGTLTLSGANTYTGNTTISAGKLSLGASGTLSTNTTVNLAGGTLDMSTFNNTVNALQSSGSVLAKGTWGAAGSGANHISAAMTGTGILTVSTGGASTSVVTSGANPSNYGLITFTNTVTGGSGDGSAPNGSVTFYDGATVIGTVTTPDSSAGAVSYYTLTISSLTVGTHSITASYAGNASYDVSMSGALSQVVNPATSTATVTVNNSATYDGIGHAATVTLSGTNTLGYVTNILTGGQTLQTNVNTYAVTATFVPFDTNYTTLTGLSAGNFTISNAPGTAFSNLTSVTNRYGTTNIVLAGTISAAGPVYPAIGETVSATINGFTLSGTVTNGTGDFSINYNDPSLATNGVAGSPYAITYNYSGNLAAAADVSTTLVITNTLLTITANSDSKTYDGNAYATNNGVTYAGFVNGETNTALAGSLSFTGSAVGAISAGSYLITPTGYTSANYLISFVSGTLTINQAASVINTAPTASPITYGDMLSASTLSGGSATPAGGSFAFTSPSTIPPVGTASYGVTYTPLDTTNYTTASTTVSVTVNPACTSPTIVGGIDGAANLCAGGPLVLTLTNATGTAPLAYQWLSNSVAIASATNSSFTNLSVLVTDAGNYQVVVANGCGSITSSVVAVTVLSTTPVITLNGANPMTVECHGTFTDPGATATNACSGALSVGASGSVDTNSPGTYTLIYAADDGNGNTNTASRTVYVVDTTPPVITWSFTNLNLSAGANGSALMPDVTGTNYILVEDACSAVLTITQTPTNNAILALGTNLVILAVGDGNGNTAYSTNTVVVQDTTAPVVTLNGANPMALCQGVAFADPGASATDNCTLLSLVTNSTVNMSLPGTYAIDYIATDAAGNSATNTRTVTVNANPAITEASPLPAATYGQSYSHTVAATGAAGYSATDLPLGLTINSASGLISGTPTVAGTSNVVVTVTNLSGCSDAKTLSLTVNPAASTITLTGSSFTYNGLAQSPGIGISGSTGARTTNYVGTGSTSYASASAPVNAGAYDLTVSVLSDANYSGATNSQAFTINPATPGLTLLSSANPAGYHDSLTFTATNLPVDATSNVVFAANGVAFSTNDVVNGGTVSLALTNLPRATTNLVTATYSGAGNYVSVSTSLTQTVTNHPPVANAVSYTRNAALNQIKIAVTNLLSHATDVDGDTLTLASVSATTNAATLMVAGGFVLYCNTNAVADEFSYTVSDGFGGTNSANVTINVDATPLFGQSTLASTTGGTATLNFTGIPAYSYSVLRSTNLTDWAAIWTTNAPPGGLFQFIDLVAPTPNAYYQLRYNP